MHAAPITKRIIMFSAVFSFAYFVMLRVSEISLKNRSDESGHALKYNDVSFENTDDTLCVKICSSKTDQKNESVILIIQILTYVQSFYYSHT